MDMHEKKGSFRRKTAGSNGKNQAAGASAETTSILNEILAKLHADRFHVEIDWNKGNMAVKR